MPNQKSEINRKSDKLLNENIFIINIYIYVYIYIRTKY